MFEQRTLTVINYLQYGYLIIIYFSRNMQLKFLLLQAIMVWEKITVTTQKMKFSVKDFFSKCDQIRRFQRIWSPLLKKSFMENFIFLCSATMQLGQQLHHRCLTESLTSTYNPGDFSVKTQLKSGPVCEYYIHISNDQEFPFKR